MAPEGAIREPKGFKIFGWVLIGVGAVLLVAALTSERSVLIPTMVFAAVFGLMGTFLLIHCRNWYIRFDASEIVSRGSFGKTVRIRYDAVKNYKTYVGRGTSQLVIRGHEGTRITANTSVFEVHRLLATIEYYSQPAIAGQPHVYSVPTVPLYGQAPYPLGPYSPGK